MKMQGIAEVADTAVVFRFKFTARPVKPSWVQREYLKRMYKVFAEKGITLNNESAGDVSDATALTAMLSEIFKTRENNGVFRENSNEIEKTIFIKSPKSVRYGDVVKVIDAAKLAGASPIGLQVDDLTE